MEAPLSKHIRIALSDDLADQVTAQHFGVAPSDPVIVKIFVRKRANDARDLSFRIPDGLDPIDLLDVGCAIDGNSALLSVYAVRETRWDDNHAAYDAVAYVGTSLGQQSCATLTEALALEQRTLVAFLRDKGYQPQFA